MYEMRFQMLFERCIFLLKECPYFLDGVALEYGHLCDSHKDCLGLTCGAVFKEGYQRHLIKLTVRWNPCTEKFELSLDGMKKLTYVKINGIF